MFWQRRTTLERPRSFACRQVSHVELAFAFNARAWPRALFFLSPVRGLVGPCWSACALRQTLGSHPAKGSFRVTWEMRKRRVNQQPELSLVRFTADKTWFSAWWGPQAFLPSASGRAALGR